ncbi:hypothetical protein CHU98_g7243 [Xylaria longipes]|nr:hypothetical protein CHU98_g7243 [Xylaria longipes]
MGGHKARSSRNTQGGLSVSSSPSGSYGTASGIRRTSTFKFHGTTSTPFYDGASCSNDGSASFHETTPFDDKTSFDDGATPFDDGTTPFNDGTTSFNDGSSFVSIRRTSKPSCEPIWSAAFCLRRFNAAPEPPSKPIWRTAFTLRRLGDAPIFCRL